MPKSASEKSTLLRKWIRDKKDLKIIDDNYIFCGLCNKRIKCDKKFQIDQHLGTESHKSKKRVPNPVIQKQLTSPKTGNSEQEIYARDLCNLFIGCNIPLHNLDKKLFQDFLKKHSKGNVNVPSSSTLRKKYVDGNFADVMGAIKNEVQNKYIWFSVDETTDVKGRYIANFIIGVLNDDSQGKGHLIAVKELEKTNNLTIARFVNDTLTNFFLPQKLPAENVLLMLTDAAPYMVKAAESLKVFFPNLIHCTCLAHGLNRVAETVKLQFPLVNSLVANIKKVFVKAPLRVQVYKENLPGLPLPPEPVVTRWGTWLNAVNFLAENYEGIKTVVCDFDSDSSAAIRKCHDLFQNPLIKKQLGFIKSNFVWIAGAITKLEARGLSLNESVSIVNSLKNRLETSVGKNNEVCKKFNSVLDKNVGFQKLLQIDNILLGNFDDDINIDPNVLCKFKYAPITSCEVERSFSSYKLILSERRQAFTMEKYLTCYCYNSNNEYNCY